MSTLATIVARRVADVRTEKLAVPIETLQAMLAQRGARRSLRSALRSTPPAIIAEYKRASPSAGAIDGKSKAAEVAAAYVRGGAAAISVLTERPSFGGTFADLARVRAAVDVPIVCKDFIIDEFQIFKAAAFGADAVLLIVAALDDGKLRTLLRCARSLALDALVEVHCAGDATRALAAGANIIGINNRDLATFEVDLTLAQRLCHYVPADRTIVAESGYSSYTQLRQAMDAGIGAFLVGEALMRSQDKEQAVRLLRGVQQTW